MNDVGDLRRQDFVVDGLGMIHHVDNFRRLHAMASPVWRRIFGPGRPLDAVGALDFVIRAAHDADRANALDRWADDGGAP